MKIFNYYYPQQEAIQSLLAVESAKLSKIFEMGLAEEDLVEDSKEWPEY